MELVFIGGVYGEGRWIEVEFFDFCRLDCWERCIVLEVLVF